MIFLGQAVKQHISIISFFYSRSKPSEAAIENEEASNNPEQIETSDKIEKEYDKVTEKLKGAIRNKDKKWLCRLVNDKTNDTSKRILISKLLKENHAHISKELAAIRFSPNIIKPKSYQVAKELSKNDTPDDLDDDNDVEVVDFADLPQELFIKIEDFIKKEIPSDFNDTFNEEEIVEVPVPPKPKPAVVDLLEEDNLMNDTFNDLEAETLVNSAGDTNEGISDLKSLKMMNEQEAMLYESVRKIDEKRAQLMEQIEKLKQTRSDILNKY